MPTALSPHNPRLERVRDLRTPRGRREQGRFAFEGPTLVAEARSSGLAIEELYTTPEALAAHGALVAELEAAGLAVFEIPQRALARLSDLETPPGLLAVARTPLAEAAAILRRPGTVLLLAGIGDPGNAGTLLRSAEAFGAAGVLFGRGSVDPFAPKVVRGAMGSLFRLPVATVDAGGAVGSRGRHRPPCRRRHARWGTLSYHPAAGRRDCSRSATSGTGWPAFCRAGTWRFASSKQARPRA